MKKITMLISMLSTLLFLSLTSGASLAEGNICKGMEQAACTTSTSCRWVKPYKRSDGTKVAGYCRKLPGQKSQASRSKDAKEKKS